MTKAARHLYCDVDAPVILASDRVRLELAAKVAI